jgi:hypothetical protein
MLSICSEPSCTTLVMGDGLCVAHESRQTRVFVRGRPYAGSVGSSAVVSVSRRVQSDLVLGATTGRLQSLTRVKTGSSLQRISTGRSST